MERDKIIQIINIDDYIFGITEGGDLYKLHIKHNSEMFDESEWKFVEGSPLAD